MTKTLRKALQEAVAEREADYRYKEHFANCRYQDQGEPSCIVGLALSKMGVSIDKLDEMDNNCDVFSTSVDALCSAELFPIKLNKTEVQALSEAQACQDQGGTWGEALKAYDQSLKASEALGAVTS